MFGTGSSYDELNDLAEGIDIGSDGLTFLPFGNGAERMLENSEPGALFADLNFNLHKKNHLLRSVLEGVAFSFYYGINIMKELGINPNVIRAGMANMFLSKIFRDTIATLNESPIQLYNTDGALGAARAAAYGAGFYSSFEEAFKGLKCLLNIDPDLKNKDKYLTAYNKWHNELNNKLKK